MGCSNKIESSQQFKDCFSEARMNEIQTMKLIETFSLEKIELSVKNVCILRYAQMEKDKSACSRIDVDKLRAYYDSLSEEQKQSELGGVIIVNGFSARDSCYNNLAVELKDTSLCEKIEQETLKNNCISYSR